MTSDRRLRPDLVVSEQTLAGGQKAFIIKEPRTRRMFRFSEVQYALCRFIDEYDERTEFPEIQRQLQARFQASLTLEQLQAFLEHLDKQMLLTTSDIPSAPPPKKQSPLYYRIPFGDPMGVLNRWAHRVAWCYTPGFLIGWACLVLFSGSLLLANRTEISREVVGLISVKSVLLLWVVNFLLTISHEFGHSFTCHRFGGEVREIGFFLIYFMPAFYADVSDAWLFPKKSHKIWTMAGGMMVDLMTWSLAMIIWRVTDPYSFVHRLCLIAMAVNGWDTLNNLIPLLKLDGYYILSIWSGVPNLRARAFQYVKDRLLAIFWSGDPARQMPGRERALYWAFGLLGLAYSWLILMIMSRYIFSWLMAHYQWQGFVMGLAAILLMFQGSWMKRVPPLWGQRGGAPRKMLVVVSLTMLLLGGGLTVWELKVSSPCSIQPIQRAQVSAEAGGLVEDVLVKEGDRVEPGMVLARLSSRDALTHLKELEARRGRVDILRAQAHRDLKRNEDLYKKHLVSEQALETSKKEYDASSQEREELMAQREALTLQVSRSELKSPIRGLVVTPNLMRFKGGYLQVGSPFCEIQSAEEVMVEIAVPEKEMADVKPGLFVEFKASGYPHRVFQGRVAFLGTSVNVVESQPVVIVRAVIPNPDQTLKVGMTGAAKIYCGKRSGAAIAFRRVIRWVRVEFWSIW